ncbi:MAG: hypothetical protein GTO51_10880 [Candidatus Latescibacteria bacterium]|nr:hypothetical protein [Candidatus Latescibacterota bacterium]NIM66469.1 hypothetical protein [Candidatus Latescibacterota bacterium]NIO02949.1 hypothetical protein [Candidatus Latescibacterota bacterium]NIO30084.1 hypothetical protein [Candidatus Latescibacterota bacterium]NIO57703.1 hypothetical protein [Candidatus Latescibacterota bacterium]
MHNKTLIFLLLPLFFLALGSTIAIKSGSAAYRSQIPDLCNSSASSAGGHVLICPEGDGKTLSYAGATITVTLKDYNGDPIPGVPAADFWLIGCLDGINLCGGSRSINADHPTDANGQTTISGTIIGGGCDDGLHVVALGILVGCPPTSLQIKVRSPDINGDLTVDLVDFVTFALGFPNPPNSYDECLDFNDDGVINLIDVALFALHFVHSCS